MRRRFLTAAACATLTGTQVMAGPLDLATVGKDSKWVVHLDMEAFRKSKLGAHFIDKVIQPKIDDADELKEMNLSISLQNISAITAFGPDFEKNGEGVLLIRSTADVKKDLDTLAGLSSLSGGQMFTMTHLNPYPLYSFKSNVFVAPNIANTVVVAKSKEQIENARQLLTGKAESLAQSKTFSDYPAAANTFFFLGMAEGFNEKAQIPPQAQVLRETRGGRFVLGESGEKLFASLVLRGKDEESAAKIQQVFQGIIALVSLSQEDKELTSLAQGAKISSESNNVTINLQFPVGSAIQRLNEEAD